MSEQELNLIIANNIKRFMEKRNLNQVDIAEHLGVTQAAVSAWCLGSKMPRMNKIDKLCELLDCTRTELMTENGLELMDQRKRSEQLQQIYDKHRVLFDAAEDATPEEIQQAVDYINFLKEKR